MRVVRVLGNCASRFAWPTQTAAMHKARGFSSSPVKSDDLFVDGETVRTGRASRELEDKPKGKLVTDLPKDRIKRDVCAPVSFRILEIAFLFSRHG